AVSNEELKIGVNAEYETLHPLLSTTAVSRYIIYLAYRPLVYFDHQNRVSPLIVKKIPNLKDKSAEFITEKGVKKLVANWEFKEGLKWGDGTLITCKDMKLSWQVGMTPTVSVASRDEYDDIESIEWTEKTPQKCVVKYKTAKWDFYFKTPSPIPSHLEEKVLNQFGKDKEGYDRNSNYQKDPFNKGLWNGPYVISEAKLGSHLIFIANKNYLGPQPKIKKIVVRMITNSGALEANLRSHNIDMVSRVGLDLDQALVLDRKIKAEDLPFKVDFQEGVTFYHIDVNLENEILKDLEVRKALSYALNKQEMVNSLFEGKAAEAFHYTAPLDRLYTADPKIISIYNADKKKAKKTLDESGWKLAEDGFRYKKGKKLSLTLSLDTEAKVNETLASIIQAQWKTVGVDLKIRSETARFLFTEVIPKRKFDLAMFAWISLPEISQKGVLNSLSIPNEKNTWTGQNFTSFKNAKVDRLLDAYEGEFNENKRKKINDEILKIFTSQIPVIPLYYRAENSVLPKAMKNFKMTGHLYFETLKVENWDLQ
ncbi:MAG: peptide ABC transporter substrate-binding protein, partial [Bdellovibrionaceae bacterium]|nr:peptide ABC transporter substrate-binding protein [Pseudobdellovibrionaceae bacterium]